MKTDCINSDNLQVKIIGLKSGCMALLSGKPGNYCIARNINKLILYFIIILN